MKLKTLKEIIKQDVEFERILLDSSFFLSDDKKGTIVRAKVKISNLCARYAKVINKNSFVITGMRPLDVEESLLEGEACDAYNQMREIARGYGIQVNDRYHASKFSKSEAKSKRFLGNVRVLMQGSEISLVFAGLGVYTYAEVAYDDVGDFEEMLEDFTSYTETEKQAEKLRTANAPLVQLVSSLHYQMIAKGMLKTVINISGYEVVSCDELPIEKAHQLIFDGKEYDLTRENLGCLALAMASYLNEKEGANINVPS